jgi:hypothetical protein
LEESEKNINTKMAELKINVHEAISEVENSKLAAINERLNAMSSYFEGALEKKPSF